MNERAMLVSLLARRAEKLSGKSRVRRAVAWPVIEAAAFARRAQAARFPTPRTVAGTVPMWMLRAASWSALGLGVYPMVRRGARQRLTGCIAIEKAFQEMGEGLRFGELLALTQLPERKLWTLLQWCSRQGMLTDCGERGWMRGPLQLPS